MQKTVSIWIDCDLRYEALDECKRIDRSFSWFVEEAVKEKLKRGKKKRPIAQNPMMREAEEKEDEI